MPTPAPEAPASLEYASDGPGALFFAEALQQMGAKLLKYSNEEKGEPFSVTFSSNRQLAGRLSASGTFGVVVRPDGNYELNLTRYELNCWTQFGRAATTEERQEILWRLRIEWKNKFKLRTQFSSGELSAELSGAASAGDYETVECVIQMNPGVFASVALILGAQTGDEALVRMALQYGADIEVAQGAPLLTAAAAGHFELVSFLMNNGANPLLPRDWFTVFESCDQPEALAMMLEPLRGVPGELALRLANHAVRHGCDEVAVGQWLAQRLKAWPVWPVDFISEIGIAASRGQTEKVKALLEDCEEDAKEALEAAAVNGQVKLLANLMPDYSDEIDDCMVTRAAARGEVEVLEVLLPYRRCDLAVQIAASAGQDDALKLFLEFGADVHADKDLALRLAVASSRPGATQMLLEHGADWRELRGNFGGPELREVFSHHGADTTAAML
jgi:hypothetical protein